MSSSIVKLHVYDISDDKALGIIRPLTSFLAKSGSIPGIWHTGIVVYGREYYFSQKGIEECDSGHFKEGEHEVIYFGEAKVSESDFNNYIAKLRRESTWSGSRYDLLKHNCINFADEIAQFVCGVRIPEHIKDLPDQLNKIGRGVPGWFTSPFTIESHVRIENRTATDIKSTSVWGIDDYDWDSGNARPDRNMTGLRVKSNTNVTRRGEVRRFATNCPFGITFYFEDGTEDSIKVRQKHAIGECEANFEHRSRSHNIAARREGKNTLVITIDD